MANEEGTGPGGMLLLQQCAGADAFFHVLNSRACLLIALMRDDVTHFLSYAKVRLGGDLSFVFRLLPIVLVKKALNA